jgi:hypothetical protein
VQSANRCSRIYEEVLIEPSWFNVDVEDLPSTPPLLQTCKQMRAEASGIFYGDNTINIKIPNADMSQVVCWLEAAPARNQLYQKSHIEIYVEEPVHESVFEPETRTLRKHREFLCKNLLAWVKLYCGHRCRRVLGSLVWPMNPDALPMSDINGGFVMRWAVRVFDLVDELLENDEELTTEDLLSHLESLLRTGTLPPLSS